ncbi:MAG: hypothetical protein K2N18_00100 [Clostridia bacterium]|nr:hypothetical protein [Clostridia bacterium]
MIGVLALISFVSNIAGVVLLFVHADNSKPASLICATVIICCGMICAVAALAIIAKSYVKRREANTIKNSNDNSADILLKAYKEIINGKEVEK